MKYTQKREENTLTVTFTCDNTEWAAFNQKAYEQNKGKYSVPGFRKGHVPKHVIEGRYGNVFFEDAIYLAAQEYYSEFLDTNSNVLPVARPSIGEDSVKVEDDGVSFDIVVIVRPEFTLGQYKGLTVEKTAPVVADDAAVDAELQKLRERNARIIEVTDRPVADGDEVNLDYSGKVDGVAFAGGTAEKQTLVIGSHTFIEGFEEQLIGMNIGETKDINVTFPVDYHSEELSGKPAVFTCTINGITVKQLPDLDDDFAKDASEFSTLQEMKDNIKAELQAKNDKTAQDADDNKLIETVVNNTTINVPAEMIDEQIDEYIDDFKYQLMYQGLNIDAYYKYTQSTEQDLRANYRDRADKAVRTRLVFEEIVKAEKIEANDDVVDEKIKEYATQINKSFEECKASLQPNELAYFQNQAVMEALLTFLKKENTIA